MEVWVFIEEVTSHLVQIILMMGNDSNDIRLRTSTCIFEEYRGFLVRFWQGCLWRGEVYGTGEVVHVFFNMVFIYGVRG